MPSAAPLPLGGGALARCTAVDPDVFAHEHWSRTPLLARAEELPRGFDDLLSAADVDELVAERGLREPFFRVVRRGGGVRTPTRTGRAGNRRLHDLADAERLRALHDEGATLVLNALHRLHPPVGRFCRALAAELGHPTQCNAYVTPAGDAQGFDLHHDTHDVFVLQVSGRKRWVVHEPVLLLPLPSQPRSGPDLVAEGSEPLLDVELQAGDCLYLPRGYVHAAVTLDEHSVHLTVGVLSTTWYDVLADVVTLAAEVPSFRDALPVRPAQGLAEALPGLLQEAGAWLAELPVEEVEALVRARLARAVPPEPVGLLGPAAAARSLAPRTPLRPRDGLVPVVTEQDGSVVLTLPDRTVTLPAVAGEGLRRLLEGPCTPAELAVGGLDGDDALVLARRMLREGVVVPDRRP